MAASVIDVAYQQACSWLVDVMQTSGQRSEAVLGM